MIILGEGNLLIIREFLIDTAGIVALNTSGLLFAAGLIEFTNMVLSQVLPDLGNAAINVSSALFDKSQCPTGVLNLF